MKADRSGEGPTRELRLEGVGLVVVGGILLAAICGAYYVGKWVGRRAQPVQALASSGQGPLSQVIPSDSVNDATEDASFFDGLDDSQNQPEPEREARAEPTTPAQQTAAPPKQDSQRSPSAADPGGTGDYYVQVFAGRDRSSAESLVRKLRTEGYVVKVFSEREGQGLLFKVRVGGFPSKDRAQRTASTLKESGYSAWVPPLE